MTINAQPPEATTALTGLKTETSPPVCAPRSIAEYQAMVGIGSDDGPPDIVDRAGPWLVEELRGPDRVPVSLSADGIRTVPPVEILYPDAVRSPDRWAARLAPYAGCPQTGDAVWDMLFEARTVADWWQGLATVVRAMGIPPADGPDGLISLFERAGYALMSTLLPDPGTAAPHPAHRSAVPASVEGSCPTRPGSSRWTRPGTVRAASRPCGCGPGGPCLWAWTDYHLPPVQPPLEWDTLRQEATASALIQAARTTGIDPRALRAGKGRPPGGEGGLWARAAQDWDFRGPLASRVYGVPVVMLTPASRWLVDGNRSTTMTTEIFGYLDDIHLDSALAGPYGIGLARGARQELRDWARIEPLRETALLQTLTGVWNTFLEATQHHPGDRVGGPPHIPRYESLSCGERKLILAVDTCLMYLAVAHDADEQTLDDLAMCQALNGYSDLGADMALGVVNNGLLLAAGRCAIPGAPTSQDAYRALSRTILAIARTGSHRPAAQAVANTVLWNITNGRHNLVERAAGLPYTWLELQWPLLRDNQKDWDEVEGQLCSRIQASLPSPLLRHAAAVAACGECGPLPRWSAVLHNALDGTHGAACAITNYVLGRKVYSTQYDSAGRPYSPGSDCAGAVALMIRRYGFSSMLDDLCWLLAGAIWFREALHLRGSIVDLAGDASHATANLPHGDW